MSKQKELQERQQWLEDQAAVLDKIAGIIGSPFDQAIAQRAEGMRQESRELEKQKETRSKGNAA